MDYIIIEIPERRIHRDVAFIATPFSNEYNFLYNIIGEAANEVGLFARRCDRHPTHADFVVAATTWIRHAKVVVAVCSPAEQPSPNVLYELGMAHGLGKATILLTNNPGALPADLRTQHALKHPDFESSNEEKRSFINALKDLMRGCINRVENGLTDTGSYRDIYTVSRIVSDTFWRHLLTILDYAKDIHRDFHGTMAMSLAEFREATRVIFNQFVFPPSAERFDKQLDEARKAWRAWRNYTLQYEIFRQGFLASLPQRQPRVETAYEFLSASGSDPLLQSKGFFITITEVLQEYTRRHDEFPMPRDENQFLPSAANNVAYMQNLIIATDALLSEMTNIATMSDRLSANMIKEFHEILNQNIGAQ